MLSGYVSVLSGRYFVPWRGGFRCRPRREASASRLVLGLRALTPLVARSTSVCRRLRPLRPLHPSVPPAPTAQQGPARSYDISMDTIVLAPTFSAIHRPPAALRTSCWVARLSPSGSSCRRAAAATSLRLPLLLGTACVRLAIPGSRPGQSAGKERLRLEYVGLAIRPLAWVTPKLRGFPSSLPSPTVLSALPPPIRSAIKRLPHTAGGPTPRSTAATSFLWSSLTACR